MIYEHFDKNSFWGSILIDGMKLNNKLSNSIMLPSTRKKLTEKYEFFVKSVGAMIGEMHPTAKTWVAKPNPFRDGVLVEIRE
ncbi:hypothetical protein [Aeromonas phage Riv-10]|uniref:Uncharacterized protein n=1 Tax=Aeromonas phage vB_AehM_DM2 TaxID=2973716 RepID=A0AA95C696_9CAUD|nr:hypothetical protein [Aeromonas phage Riv-10]UYD59580.1 hypothetical protein JNMOADIG_00051 [Aeromonas phage avDM5]UYD60446.1 hypothetical protein NPHMPGLK_00111 [Aeromonas phage avDM2]UYD60718.1 hypothetical protein NHNEHLNL_00122 [Aeromonas phage avDM2]